MTFSQKAKAALIFSVVCILISTVIAFAAPGDDSDPLVTLSYITDVLLPDIDSRIDRKVNTAVNEAMQGNSVSNPSAEGGETFVLVNIEKGYSLIGEEGTEMVVRAGSGTVIATSQGGLADLTSGVDLADGSVIPLNHHLLVPRSDSRGLDFDEKAIVLIKGAYKVTK